jgi:hypothetical protein
MLDRQWAGIDLRVKALAWEDEDGQVWLTYHHLPVGTMREGGRHLGRRGGPDLEKTVPVARRGAAVAQRREPERALVRPEGDGLAIRAATVPAR